jgi:hypothetical protein
VLLLDEPFGALDAKVRKELRRWLRRLHDDLHVTSIYVTHDQEEALEGRRRGGADERRQHRAGRLAAGGVGPHPPAPSSTASWRRQPVPRPRPRGEVHLEGLQARVAEPGRSSRTSGLLPKSVPHDLDVSATTRARRRCSRPPERHTVSCARRDRVGRCARLELLPVDGAKQADNAGSIP